MQSEYLLDNIQYQITGETGTPVLFLHGWGGDVNTMNVLSQPISEHRKSISVSMPGFGSSPEPSDNWGTWDYVEAIYKWLDMMKFKKVDIISHSFGGRVAIGLAYRYPDCANQMILIGSAGLVLPKSPKIRAKLFAAKSINRIGKMLGDDINKKLQARKQKMGSADWLAASPTMRRILGRVIREDLSVEISQIRAKTLLLWGSEDDAVPVKLAKRMNELIKESKLTILPGAGHYPFLDQTGNAINEIWDWLELPSVW